MSYRNPRFYQEDYGAFGDAFQKNFDQQFGNVMEYYENQAAQRKAYEDDLFTQAEKMREDAKAAGATAADLKGKIEDQVQSFLKEGLEVGLKEGAKGRGFLNMNVRETGKKNKLQLQEANNSFNAEIDAANQITDRAFVSGLQIDEDYDHGSGSYLEYASVVKALQSQKGSADFSYDGDNKFSFGVTIDNPRWMEGDPESEKKITYSATDIQRLIGENDPEARKQFDENLKGKDGVIASLVGQVKTEHERRFAIGNTNLKNQEEGAAFLGTTDAETIVNRYIDEMAAQDENNPDEGNMVHDIFNNVVKFNDATRVEELQKFGGEGAAMLLNKAMKTEGNKKIPTEFADELALLLDTPSNDITYQTKVLKKMGITDPDEVKSALSSLDGARTNMVRRYLMNEVMADGVTSSYIKPNPPKPVTSGGGGKQKYNGNDAYTIMQGKKTADVSQKTVNAISTFGADIPSFGISLQNGERVYTNPSAGELVSQEQESEFVDSFLNAEFTFGGSKHNASGFEMGRDGKVTLTFDKMTRDVDIIGTQEMYDKGEINRSQIGEKIGSQPEIFTGSTLEYDIYSPDSMRNFFDATSTEAGGTGEYARDFKSKGYDVQMVSNFTKPAGLESLSKPKMGAWLRFVDDNGGHDKLIQYAAANPQLFEGGETHWIEFSQKYRKEIDMAAIAAQRAVSFNQ